MIYIVGNGLFGRIAHDVLEAYGIEATIIDDSRQEAGSLASGNITKPSWVSGLGDDSKLAYSALDALYGLHKFTPTVGLGKKIDLYYVSREDTIKAPDIRAKVDHVSDGSIMLHDGQVLTGDILIATGVWASELVADMPVIENIVGVSMVYTRPEEYEPRFDVWAPYKQSISYDFGDKVWFGDGTAIKEKHFRYEPRLEASSDRAIKHGLSSPLEVHKGYRPYVKDHKNGYFAQVYPHTWVSTGGGKNGIVLAMLQAKKFLEAVS